MQIQISFLFAGLALVPGLAISKASFKCAKADSTVEKTICGDASLAALDVELAEAYKQAAAAAGSDQSLLSAEEHGWLHTVSDECDRSNANGCIRDAFEKRILELRSDAVSPTEGITVFRLNRVSRDFDFTLRMRAHAPESLDDYREGPARLLVSKKGSTTPFQAITLESVFVSFGKDGKPLTNTAPLYDDQGVINVGDFNFDGHEDFAVQTGNNGPYGGPTYSVYLFAPSENQLRYSEAFSQLTIEGLGFFDIDVKKRRIVVLSKSGCCYHVTTEYQVKNNLPVPDSREVEDATKETNYLLISHEKYVHGEWRGTTKRVPVSRDDQPK